MVTELNDEDPGGVIKGRPRLKNLPKEKNEVGK